MISTSKRKRELWGIVGRAYSSATLFRKLLFSGIIIVFMGIAVSIIAIQGTRDATDLLGKFYLGDVKMAAIPKHS